MLFTYLYNVDYVYHTIGHQRANGYDKVTGEHLKVNGRENVKKREIVSVKQFYNFL